MTTHTQRFDVLNAIEQLLRRAGATGRRTDFKLLPPIYQTCYIAFDLDYAVSNETLDKVVMHRVESVLVRKLLGRGSGRL